MIIHSQQRIDSAAGLAALREQDGSYRDHYDIFADTTPIIEIDRHGGIYKASWRSHVRAIEAYNAALAACTSIRNRVPGNIRTRIECSMSHIDDFAPEEPRDYLDVLNNMDFQRFKVYMADNVERTSFEFVSGKRARVESSHVIPGAVTEYFFATTRFDPSTKSAIHREMIGLIRSYRPLIHIV